MKIITDYIFPPIPYRHMDWIAYLDGQEEGINGFGRTEQEAIKDLQDNLTTKEPKKWKKSINHVIDAGGREN